MDETPVEDARIRSETPRPGMATGGPPSSSPVPRRASARLMWSHPAHLLSLIDILTPNEVEVGLLSGATITDERDAAAAARRLLDTGVRHVIVTLGEKGSLWVTHGHEQLFPPCRVTPVDSTAAGDAFNGALACALAEGREMDDAIRFANAAGALTVTRRGAQSALPAREEIEQMLRSNQGARHVS
jgi:ribokinase